MFDVLQRITQLREERGWSEYRLSENSDISQTTISKWYKDNMIPSFKSLEKICNAFDITMAQFFNNDETLITDEQRKFIDDFNMLNDSQKKKLEAFIDNKSNNK